MATKKQKRQAGIERHQREMETLRQTGLAAQKAGRVERLRESLKEWEELHNDKHFKFLSECPHCGIIQRAINQGRKRKDGVEDIEKILNPPYRKPEPEGALNVVFSNKAPIEDSSVLEMECI